MEVEKSRLLNGRLRWEMQRMTHSTVLCPAPKIEQRLYPEGSQVAGRRGQSRDENKNKAERKGKGSVR